MCCWGSCAPKLQCPKKQHSKEQNSLQDVKRIKKMQNTWVHPQECLAGAKHTQVRIFTWCFASNTRWEHFIAEPRRSSCLEPSKGMSKMMSNDMTANDVKQRLFKSLFSRFLRFLQVSLVTYTHLQYSPILTLCCNML